MILGWRPLPRAGERPGPNPARGRAGGSEGKQPTQRNIAPRSMFAGSVRCRCPSPMLQFDLTDCSFRVLLRDGGRSREAALEELRERTAGLLAMALVVAVPAYGMISGSQVSLVEQSQAAEPGSAGKRLEPPRFQVEAVMSRLERDELTRREIRALQSELKRRGFDPGPIDGVAGRRTLSALNAYRQSLRLSAVPAVDREAVTALQLR